MRRRLVPKVVRIRVKKRITPVRTPYTLRDEQAAFTAFRQQARSYVSSPHSPLEWLAIAQHFGVPTRLLDWSDNLLIAAWFAVEDAERTDCNAAIWVTRGQPQVDADSSENPFLVAEPRVYRPPHLEPRMASQGSVLMLCPEPSKPVGLKVVHKITIKGKQRFHLRKRLDACGVNAKSVYADLAGVGGHLAWRYENGWLSGYRPPR